MNKFTPVQKTLLQRLGTISKPNGGDLDFWKDMLRELEIKGPFDPLLDRMLECERGVLDLKEKKKDLNAQIKKSELGKELKRLEESIEHREGDVIEAWFEIQRTATELFSNQRDLFRPSVEEVLGQADVSRGDAESAEGEAKILEFDPLAHLSPDEQKEAFLAQHDRDEVEYQAEINRRNPHLFPAPPEAVAQPAVALESVGGLVSVDAWKRYLFARGDGEWSLRHLSEAARAELAVRLFDLGNPLNDVVRRAIAETGVVVVPAITDERMEELDKLMPALKVLAGCHSKPFKMVESEVLAQAVQEGYDYGVLEADLAEEIRDVLLVRFGDKVHKDTYVAKALHVIAQVLKGEDLK